MAEAQFTIKVVIKDAKQQLIADQEAIEEAAFKGMNDFTLSVIGRAKRSFGKAGWLGWISRRLSRAVFQRVRRKRGGIVGTVGVLAVVPYGAIHEFGGMAGRNLATRIPARPYLRRSIKEELPKLTDKFKKRMAEQLRKAKR